MPPPSSVTLTIGGNDAGFADVLRSAASPAWLSDSDTAIDGAEAVIRDRLPRLLTGVYTAVRAAAPHADVVAATYPRLFNGTDCHPLTFFTPEELDRLNRVGDRLATVIGDAAGDAGIEVVDVRDGFEGHAVCDPAPMVNGLVLPVWESFHPTASGHAEYARLLASGRSSRRGRPTRSGSPSVRTPARRPRASGCRGWTARRAWRRRMPPGSTGSRCARSASSCGAGGPAASTHRTWAWTRGQDGRRHRARWRPRRRSGPWVAEGGTPRRVRMRGPDHPSG